MGMVMCKRESASFAEDGASDTLVSKSSEFPALEDDLFSSVKLAGETVMEDILSSLIGLSLNSGPNSWVSLSPIIPTVAAVQILSVVSTVKNG
ncbi:hypothetical protein AYI68_g3725 [Smittium mucronatum]|uniref:Uncharacterized protein n=1 Tax=Smittium mucronatum TaxID=133383 RepID=A0A1R0GZ16_9FUNG|nr:hypothetical protein AYI68_g3725 [Smittium mucronatum]